MTAHGSQLASFPGSPPLACNYCMTFELKGHAIIRCECEFKGHTIIACKVGEPGNEARSQLRLFIVAFG